MIMRRILCLLKSGMLISVMIVLAACSNTGKAKEPPTISVMCESLPIDYVVGLNHWNGTNYNREDTFKIIAGEGSDYEIPNLTIESSIQIDFAGNVPDSVSLEEYVLDKDGSTRYNASTTRTIPLEIIDNKSKFLVGYNFALALSSDSKDYEPGNTLRGFRLTCSWGENACEYAFIITTDGISESMGMDGANNLGAAVLSKTKDMENLSEVLYNGFPIQDGKYSIRGTDEGVEAFTEIFLKWYKENKASKLIVGDEPFYNIADSHALKNLGISIFKNHQGDTFILYDGEIHVLGFSFGGLGLLDIRLCDMDQDGNAEILYTYSWGSGLHRSMVGHFDLGTKKQIAAEYVYLNHDMVLSENEEGTWSLYHAEVEFKDKVMVDFDVTKGHILGEIVYENGQIRVVER